MILNILFWFSLEKKINLFNFSNFNLILVNKYKKSFFIFLNYPQLSKYNWSSNNSIFNKFININYLNIFDLNNFYFKKNNQIDVINNIIFFKKKSSLLKKSIDYEFSILNYVNKNRDEIYYNHRLNVLNCTNKINSKNKFYNSKNLKNLKISKKWNTNLNSNYKTVDFKKKFNLIFEKNRTLLKKFLKIKPKRRGPLSKFLKNFIRYNPVDFLFNFEYKLINLLTRCSFFFNHNDCIWFLKNGFISLNGFVTKDVKKILKPLDVITLSFNDYYYFYYKFMLDNCFSNLYKFNPKIWKINYGRNNKKPREEEKYPKWIDKYIYYNNDVPKFIEIDYICMTMVLLNYSYDINYIDYYNIKFLNLYLNRLYNWKIIN